MPGAVFDLPSFNFHVPIFGSSAAKHAAPAKKQSARVNPIGCIFMPPSSTDFQVPSMFLFQLTNRKRIRISGCELWKIDNDGSLSDRSNFALLNLLTKNKVESWWIGPDSMKIDSKGNIYVAQWFGGKILKISPDGKLVHVFEIAAGDGTTNVAFGEGEKELFVTVVKDPKDPKAKGSIVKIPNVK